MAMQRNYFTILFFIKKSKLLKNGEAPICMRITVNGQRAEIQIKRSVDISKWNSQKECAIGKERKSMELNHYLDTVRMKVLQIHRELEQDGKPITADVLKRRYYGEGDSPKMLLEVFQEHNRKYRELMGKDYVAGTVLRYERTARYLGELLQKEYRMNDIPLKEINHEFIARFEHYVKTEKSCAQNATVKYLKNFKKIIKVALVNKWITDDPFLEIHFKQTKTNRAFLTEEELNILLKKEFTIPRLQTVRDIFVFCALTGLAFTDVQHLRYEHIIKDVNGEYWIRKAREKTDNMCDIPLLDIPRMILEKYKTHPECLKKGVVLPVPSNQRMNSYLKEIADICGINKPLSTHVARHTFATVALANRVSMESVAKMLGHTDIRTTKIYARVLDKTVSEEMKGMRSKFVV
ncbi:MULTISPECIES: site-specific integrase [Bacteroidales]|jgi:site-specific recombinase XerD|nr:MULTISPECIES: site-specific integrase [Parabacteroides]MTT11082.1 tyrosine-type recombinase/integrase [Parabacteroides merdae]UBD60175.1 site-specific integrase [Parabacteroides merdae]UVR01887.1 site-specific integrase [Parabacteroides distasonis]UVR97210.1 site-specific integrase [Parabacteroides distasonis]